MESIGHSSIPNMITFGFDPAQGAHGRFILKLSSYFSEFVRKILETYVRNLIGLFYTEYPHAFRMTDGFGVSGHLKLQGSTLLQYDIPDAASVRSGSDASIADFLDTLRILSDLAILCAQSKTSNGTDDWNPRKCQSILSTIGEPNGSGRCRMTAWIYSRVLDAVFHFDESERDQVVRAMTDVFSTVSDPYFEKQCVFSCEDYLFGFSEEILPECSEVDGAKRSRLVSLIIPGAYYGSLVYSEAICREHSLGPGNYFVSHQPNSGAQVLALLAGLATIGELAFMKGLAKV